MGGIAKKRRIDTEEIIQIALLPRPQRGLIITNDPTVRGKAATVALIFCFLMNKLLS